MCQECFYSERPEKGLKGARTENDAPRSRILIVDDHHTMGKILTRLLDQLDYDVCYFDDAENALYHLRNSKSDYQAVLTDYHMPGMMGDEFARLIRTLRPDLPIMLMSSDPEACEDQSGFDFVLDKSTLKVNLIKALVQIERRRFPEPPSAN